MTSQGLKITLKNGIKTPCINVCKLDDSKSFCMGCLRTTNEITKWSRWSDKDRDDVIEDLPRRHNSKANKLSHLETS